MLAECRVYYTAVEQYLGSVGNVIECLEGFFELVIVVVPQGNYPRFYLLFEQDRQQALRGQQNREKAAELTCLSDMT